MKWTSVRQQFARLVLVSLTVASLPVSAADIVKINVQNLTNVNQTNVPATFGQVFRPGDVPAGAEIVARRVSDGTLVPLQVDRKAIHEDGSLRHAILTARLTRLDDSETIALSPGTQAASTPAVQLSDVLQSAFSAQVSIKLSDGKTYTADARQLLESANAQQRWLYGPLVSEWIVGGAIKDASGNTHPHMAAYFHIRAYAGLSRVKVDVVIENGWTFVPDSNALRYDAAIKVGGATAYTRNITHYHHTRWHKAFWWGSAANVYVDLDEDYLQATGAVPKYLDLNPSSSYLNGMLQESIPMAHGDLTKTFGNTGAQDQIGPLPRWTTAYVVTTDRRAFNSMLANDDHGGSYSVHYRDETTGLPVSIADYPELTLAVNGDLPTASGGNPNIEDQAHQPSIGFVSYLTTGDYFYLEEMQFWTSWNHLWTNRSDRQGSKGLFDGQVRGQAWTMRNLGQAAYATPDDHRYKALLVSSVGHNLAYNEALYPDNPSANNLGALDPNNDRHIVAPWQDDFYTWTMGYLVGLGFDASEMRDWKATYPVGRMGVSDYCYIQATAYNLTPGPDSTDKSSWWPDFATLYEQNFGSLTGCPLGAEMVGHPQSPTGYPSNLRPALAAAVDSGVPGADAAWKRFLASAVHPDQSEYSDYPNWAVVPRGADVPPGTTPPPSTPGSLGFSSATYGVGEGAGSAAITVSRGGGSDGEVSVSYTTSSGGSATEGADYTFTEGFLTWLDGDTANKSFSVPVIDDAEVEGNETVNLALSNAGGAATLGAQTKAGLTISENDSVEPPVLCFGLEATLVGTNASETIKGTPSRDIIHGLGGNDLIYGYGRNDVICGGEGNDRLFGGDAHDVLIGGSGDDRLFGELGDDRLYGGDHLDYCHGGSSAGRDRAISCERRFAIP